MFPFLVTNLTVDFFYFFIFTPKLHAYAINDLLYCGGKMATKSKMFVKQGCRVCFWDKHRLSRKLPHTAKNWPSRTCIIYGQKRSKGYKMIKNS